MSGITTCQINNQFMHISFLISMHMWVIYVLEENKMKVPSTTTKRTAVGLGIKYSMTDEQVIELLKGAKVPKAQRDIFIPWFRRAESKSR